MIDAQKVFDQPVANYLITYNNISKIAKGQVDDYPAGYLLEYNYFKKYYKMIATDLIKQQALDANPKKIQQINFTGSLESTAVTSFIIEEAKEIVLDFSQRTVKVF